MAALAAAVMKDDTYFVSSNILQFRRLLQSDRSAGLFIAVLYHYREQGKYLLHEFVVMPHHFHLLFTPTSGTTLERAMQLIKGGFSFKAKEQFGWRGTVWHRSFRDRRVRDAQEYARFRHYLLQNPVVARYCADPEEWPHSSAGGKFALDPVPQRLKPASFTH
jgi:putative transposase